MVLSFTRYRNCLPLVFLVTVVTGCSRNDFFKAGPLRSAQRVVPAISEIVLHDRVNLILTQDTLQQVTVEAGENLLNAIETAASDNIITIKDNNRYKWMRDLNTKVNVYVSVVNLKKISYHGAGDIISTNQLTPDGFEIDSWNGTGTIRIKLKTPRVRTTIRSANADVILEGSAAFNQVYCADLGSVDCRNFLADEVLIEHRSVRNSFVNAVAILKANILYKGDVYYKGAPNAIELFTNSSGKLYRLP